MNTCDIFKAIGTRDMHIPHIGYIHTRVGAQLLPSTNHISETGSLMHEHIQYANE